MCNGKISRTTTHRRFDRERRVAEGSRDPVREPAKYRRVSKVAKETSNWRS